jgi:hypothetical protein
MKLVATATAVLFLASPAFAGPAGDTLKTALYAGTLADGLAKLEPLAAGGDTEASFGVGALRLARTLEKATQTLYTHGFETPDAGPLASPDMIPPIPKNPNPTPFDYAGVRQMLSDLVSGLDDARAAFDAAGAKGHYIIEINPLKVLVDANGDGRAERNESLAGLLALWNHTTIDELLDINSPTGSPRFEYFGFDRADAYWLAGYTEVLAAQADFLLAHDFSGLVNASFHHFFPRAGFPMQEFSTGGQLMFDPKTDSGIADLIAAVHQISWPVTDPARLSGVRERLKAILAYSRKDWDAILAETDDDHELIPSPRQTQMIPDTAVTDDKIAAWRATLDEADKILDGTLLVPHWRFKQGFDLKAYFETARQTDFVMLLTGYGALPYLKDGPVASQADFRQMQQAFGDEWLGYAFWFN